MLSNRAAGNSKKKKKKKKAVFVCSEFQLESFICSIAG